MRETGTLLLLILCFGCSSNGVVPYRVPKSNVWRNEPAVDYSQLRLGLSLVETTETVTCHADIVDPQGCDLYPVVISNKTGYVDGRGNMVIAPCVTWGNYFEDGLAAFLDPPRGWAEERENRFRVAHDLRDLRFGFVNRRGETVFKPYLFGVSGFSQGVAAGWCGPRGYDHVVLLETNGIARHLKDTVGYVGSFSEGFATVFFGSDRRRGGCIDKLGRLVVAPIFGYVGTFKEGLAPAEADGKFGYIGTNGLFDIKPTFDQADSFSEGLAKVGVKGKVFFIDKTGRRLGERSFDDAHSFSEGLAYVVETDKRDGTFRWTFVNRQGEVAMRWHNAKESEWNCDAWPRFAEGLAAVPVGEGMGFTDKNGKIVLSGYLLASEFRGGLAWVATGTDVGYIDGQGRFVWKQARPR